MDQEQCRAESRDNNNRAPPRKQHLFSCLINISSPMPPQHHPPHPPQPLQTSPMILPSLFPMLPDPPILLHARHMPQIAFLPDSAPPLELHVGVDVMLALVEVRQHRRVVRVPLEHVRAHAVEEARAQCLREGSFLRDGGWDGRRGDGEFAGAQGLVFLVVGVGWVGGGGGFGFKGYGGVQVAEVGDPFLVGSEGRYVLKAFEVEVSVLLGWSRLWRSGRSRWHWRSRRCILGICDSRRFIRSGLLVR